MELMEKTLHNPGKDVPVGFKETEIGLIPTDWQVAPLGTVGSFKKGKGIKKDEVSKDGIPCVRYGEIYTHHHDVVRHFNSFISKEIAANSQRIQKGDILFAGSGETAEEIGKCVAFLGDEEAYAGGDIVIFSPRKTDTEYLAYVLNSNPLAKQKAQIGQGDAVVHIYAGGLSKLAIPLPPTLTEQRAIATALSDVDELIASLERLVAKKQAIKQATMQELLTGRKRLEGFEGEWMERTFGECFEFLQTGNNSRAELSEFGDIGYIHYGDIHSKWHLILDIGKEKLPGIAEISVRHLPFLKDGDLIIADASEDYEGVGASVEISNLGNKRVVSGLHTILLRSKNNSVADGYKAYLTSIKAVKDQLVRAVTGISVYGLSKGSLKAIKLWLPPTEFEQRAIAELLGAMDNEIAKLIDNKNKVSAIKRAMLHNLLTGKTRIV